MQPFRFQQSKGLPFSGNLIDRSKTIKFSFNGRSLEAFEGDTLLSALLANGCRSWRDKNQHFIPLNQDSIRQICLKLIDHPFVSNWHGDIALEDQMKLETIPAPTFLGKLGQTFSRKERFQIETPPQHSTGYFDLAPSGERHCDIVVVGGGISGLQAALCAAELGRKVTLLERTKRLGGMSDYYGQADDEEAPTALIERLSNDISDNDLISVEMATEALDVRKNRVLIMTSHQNMDGKYEQQLEWLGFEQLILAVGADYANGFGAGLNGTHLANQVYRLATDYGIMPAENLSVITGGNSGYRLAQLLLEAGIGVDGLYDPRLAPTSRHIDFAKAVGVRMHMGENATGMSVVGGQVEVEFGTALLSGERKVKRQFFDIIISNAPKPNLDLWVRAGGHCQLNAASVINPTGNIIANASIIGSAHGSISQEACLAQARHVVAQQLNQDADQTPLYVGMYKYESPAEALELNGAQVSVSNIRHDAQVPAFSPQPEQHAISEYLFERSGSNLTIAQMRNFRTLPPQPTSPQALAFDKMARALRTRFKKPIFVEIQALGYLNLSIGQHIYDSDGINQPPHKCGIVVEIEGKMQALIEGESKELLGEVYVQTRSGLFAAKLGDTIAQI